MRLIHHPDAQAELIDAARFYEGIELGLGARFLDAVDAAVCIIEKDPQRSRVLEAGVRRCLVSRFPYSIYYRVGPGEIRILAFKHHGRHPDYWRYRRVE